MADKYQIARILLALGADRPPAPTQFPGAGRQQTAHDAQQAGLAAAVGARHAQQLAAADPEAQPAEQAPFASRALELSRFKHRPRTFSRFSPANFPSTAASLTAAAGADI